MRIANKLYKLDLLSTLIAQRLGTSHHTAADEDSSDVPIVASEHPLLKHIRQRIILFDKAARVARVSGRAPVTCRLDEQRIEFFADLERPDPASHRTNFSSTERGKVEERCDAQRSLGKVDRGLVGERRSGILDGLRNFGGAEAGRGD